MKPKIGIVGCGYVGKAMYNFFKNHYQTRVYDPKFSSVDGIQSMINCYDNSLDAINRRCNVAIVCVPTPIASNGSCDISIVENVINEIDTPFIILKSTVEPGTTEKLKKKTSKKHIVFSPEFCGESTYWSPYSFDKDVKETPFFIFGGDPEDTQKAVDLYMPITGPKKHYRQTTALNAELTKYMENTYFASKIIFAYEMERICKAAGANFQEVRDLWGLDPRVDIMHTATFAQNDAPYGGKCLPKDLAALVEFSKKQGYKPEFLEEVQASNRRIAELRKTERDS